MGNGCDVLVVGAGPAGLAAAWRAAQSGLRVSVVDDNPAAGGQIWRGEQANLHLQKHRSGLKEFAALIFR